MKDTFSEPNPICQAHDALTAAKELAWRVSRLVSHLAGPIITECAEPCRPIDAGVLPKLADHADETMKVINATHDELNRLEQALPADLNAPSAFVGAKVRV